MSITTARISSARLRSAFVARVEKISGQKLLACYQCGKCSAGCPMAPHMDVLPNQIIRLAQLGMQERLLASRAIWTCVSCMTCNSRCPKDIRIAEVIESLRDMAMRNGQPRRPPEHRRTVPRGARRIAADRHDQRHAQADLLTGSENRTMKLIYYPGCTLKNQARNFDVSTVSSMAELDVEVEELDALELLRHGARAGVRRTS